MRRTIFPVLVVLLFACSGGGREGTLLPDRIHGADLAESLAGEEAAGMIARLHGKGVAPVKSEIGFYGSFRPPLTLYVSVFGSAEEARDQMDLMVEAIGGGSSGFTEPRSERVEGVDAEFVVGHGQDHVYYAEGDRLVWLAAPTGILRPALLELLGESSRPARAEDPFPLGGGRELLGNPDIPAVSYSGHRKVPRSVENTPTVEETKEDLRILSAMGIKMIRTYNTTDFPHSERTLQAIRELQADDPGFEMYVMLGAWIQCRGAYTDSVDHTVEDAEFNRREIEGAIRLANEYPDIVRIVAVGNESMVTWQAHYVPASAVLRWVTYLRDARDRGDLPAGTRITTSDNWASLGGGASYRNEDLAELLRRVDFLSLHTYAFLDTYYNPAFGWASGPDESGLPVLEQVERAVARSIEWQEHEVQAVQAYLDSLGLDREIHIGETGWASRDDSFFDDDGTRAADEYIAGLFHAAVRAWTRETGRTCFYFEAFDEPWKSGGTDQCEGHFGLFTVDGQAKYALWDRVDAGIFEGLTRGGNPIGKTRGGDEQALLKDLSPPAHFKP